MSALGLAAVGFQGGKQLDYENRQRDYEAARMDAMQPGLADAAAAVQSGNQLRASQNNAELGLVPARAKLAGSQLGLQQGEADLKTELQPTMNDVTRKKADMAQQQTNQEFLDFGNKLQQLRLSNAITQADASEQAMTKLADILHTSQSPKSAMDFYNTMVDIGSSDGLPGQKATSVRMAKRPDGTEEIAFFNGDNRIFGMDQATMGRYLARGQKLDIKDVKPGHNLVGINTRTGATTSLYTAPESQVEKASKKPAEVATMDWMIEKGVAKDANDAWNKLRTAREKGKAGFISDMMKGAIMPGMSEDDLRKHETAFGDMFDRISGSGRSSASNSGAVNTLDPKVQSLFE